VFPYAFERMKGMLTQVFNRPPQQATPFDLALEAAAIAYRPPLIRARVLALQPADRPQARDLERSWAEYLKHGSFQVRDAPGDHITMFEEPHVKALANCIKTSLRDNVVEIRRAS
jgi:thioesterase domain-containing protein